MNVAALKSEQGGRYIDPNARLEKQVEVLRELIKNPPENSRTVTFTPALSDWILTELNTGNRKRKPARIRRYAAAMEREAWYITGETIVFSKSGRLLDGQNRFAACVRAGVPFRSLVVFGIDDAVFVALNSGKARTPGDTFLTSAAVAHPEIVAPAVRWIMLYESGNPTARTSFSNQEMFDYWKTKVDEDRLKLAIERSLKAVKVVPRGSLAAHLYLFDQRSASTTKRFADDLAKNIRGARKLNDMLTRMRKQNMGRLHDVWISAMVVLTWNAYRAGEVVTTRHLRWNESKDYPAMT